MPLTCHIRSASRSSPVFLSTQTASSRARTGVQQPGRDRDQHPELATGYRVNEAHFDPPSGGTGTDKPGIERTPTVTDMSPMTWSPSALVA
jgi:hypothetical protein